MQGDLQRVLIRVAAALLLLWGVVLGIQKFRSHQSAQAQTGAAVAGQAQAGHEAVAKEHEAQLVSLQDALAKSRAEVARAKAALAAAKSSVPVVKDSLTTPVGDDLSPTQVSDPEHAQETPKNKLDERDVLIQAQDAHISTLESALKEATLRGDSYKLALDDANKRANLQVAAIAALKSAQTASRWQGRIEGFATGVATSYVGGRLAR